MAKMLDSVDGANVDHFATTFSGTIEVELPDARYMTFEEELLVVARVRVKVPRFRESKGGEITRVGVLGLKELALVRSEELRQHLCETLGLDSPAPQLELEFETPVSVPEAVPAVDEEQASTMSVSSWRDDATGSSAELVAAAVPNGANRVATSRDVELLDFLSE